MSKASTNPPARFGTVLGIAPGEVPIYSSHYPTVDEHEMPDNHSYRSYVDGIFMGYKWQCVELARRWLYLNKGYIFDDVGMAYDIFNLRSVRVIRDNSRLPLRSFRNGSRRPPEPGCLLIWNEGGEFERTGHVAIVTDVLNNVVRCIEQNVDHVEWHNKQDYSRELRLSVNEKNEYTVHCTFPDTSILGWVIQTDDDRYAEKVIAIDPHLLTIVKREVTDRGQLQHDWLDMAQADERAYVEMMQGHKLTGNADHQYTYLCMSETAHRELKYATDELHAMFLNATHVILENDALLEHFDIPRALWKKIRQSWNQRSNEMITGRFDVSLSKDGIKTYEYNADSASCHLECGKIQIKWAAQVGCQDGWCPGEDLFEQLVYAWKSRGITGTVHLMRDKDAEEIYHALYMKSALEAAGITCKIIEGVDVLSWDGKGHVVDADGDEIIHVWKTWAWETALDQIRLECAADEQALQQGKPLIQAGVKPRLVDVLLRDAVMVYEPLWTLITSNKAMLPILCQLFPGSPYLLNTQFTLTEELRNSGYVSKPIAGRSGSNIAIFDRNDTKMNATDGRFENRDLIYQEFFKLPSIDDRKHQRQNIQLSTFTVDGKYAGSCARVDTSPIVTAHSDLLALRVIADAEFNKPDQ